MALRSISELAVWVVLVCALCAGLFDRCQAQTKSGRHGRPDNSGSVYPQFRNPAGVIRWLSDQMPLKVYVSRGLTLDGIVDEQLGAPQANVDNLAAWPDLVANVVEQEQLPNLRAAEGFLPEHYQAAVQGINSWKPFEREGLFAFQFTDDPSDADIYVFWTHHFVNKLGLGLFANDIRGYTAKRVFPHRALLSSVQSGHPPDFLRPVVVVLRTTDGRGNPMPLPNMKASAAHEFGHALGIDGHSGNPNDLMSVYYGYGAISANDAATIRHLYRLVPDLVP